MKRKYKYDASRFGVGFAQEIANYLASQRGVKCEVVGEILYHARKLTKADIAAVHGLTWGLMTASFNEV